MLCEEQCDSFMWGGKLGVVFGHDVAAHMSRLSSQAVLHLNFCHRSQQ